MRNTHIPCRAQTSRIVVTCSQRTNGPYPGPKPNLQQVPGKTQQSKRVATSGFMGHSYGVDGVKEHVLQALHEVL